MKKLKVLFISLLTIWPVYFTDAQPVTDKEKSASTELLAQRLVNQCANIKEGEFVLIQGGVREMELLEDISVNVMKKGAHPLLIVGSDRISKRYFNEVPSEFDGLNELSLKLFSFINAVITVDYNEDPGLYADVPPERLAAISQAGVPANELAVSRKIKIVGLGNGLYPTEARARMYGISLKELSDVFWNGINVDYNDLETAGKALKTVLGAGRDVHITNPNGTDLKMKIENRPVSVLDGSISDEDLKGTFASSQVYLPAGEVVVTPVPGTAEGKVVVDYDFNQGGEIRGLTMIFEKGKLVSMTADSGIERLKAIYDAAAPGKEDLSFLDIGINPNVKIIPGSKLVSWMPAGMVTVGIGNNIFAGGDNKTPFEYPVHIPGCTLKVDGKVLIDGGTLAITKK